MHTARRSTSWKKKKKKDWKNEEFLDREVRCGILNQEEKEIKTKKKSSKIIYNSSAIKNKR